METIPQTFLDEPIFRRLGKVAKYATLNDREKKAYKESLKVYRDNYAIAETERAEGRAEGKAEGIASMIKGMARQGLSLDLIASVANMTVDKVKQIISLPDHDF